ncbi:MAG: 30S ribosomal protein S16 [Gammaproteobacteria bacterium]|nr:30S ribosomal protein S16 [Gammaproteobacteria bacterium]
MVTIRLARHGGKKHPFYQVTVAEKTAKRDGRFIERVGFYNPLARGGEEELRIDLERVDYWLSVGAQPTERAARLIARHRKAQSNEAEAEGEAAEAEAEAVETA